MFTVLSRCGCSSHALHNCIVVTTGCIERPPDLLHLHLAQVVDALLKGRLPGMQLNRLYACRVQARVIVTIMRARHMQYLTAAGADKLGACHAEPPTFQDIIMP